MALLEVRDVHTYYGNIHALTGILITVDEGEIVTMIGANGAGKSTTLNTICGLLHPRSGSVLLAGQEIQEIAPHDIVGMGVSQAPEGRRVFSRLTMQENLEMGAFSHTPRDYDCCFLAAALARGPTSRSVPALSRAMLGRKAHTTTVPAITP
jgi:branched-chain amino acid transport system ATP-binding protein